MKIHEMIRGAGHVALVPAVIPIPADSPGIPGFRRNQAGISGVLFRSYMAKN